MPLEVSARPGLAAAASSVFRGEWELFCQNEEIRAALCGALVHADCQCLLNFVWVCLALVFRANWKKQLTTRDAYKIPREK